MHDGVWPGGADRLTRRSGVAQIHVQQFDPGWHRTTMAPPEIVENDHVIAALSKQLDRDAADVSGTAGNQDPHAVLFYLIRCQRGRIATDSMVH
jgi:hypothetical protein